MFRKKKCYSHTWTDFIRYNAHAENPKVRFCKECGKREFSYTEKVPMEVIKKYCKSNLASLSKRNLQEVQRGRLGLIEFVRCQAWNDYAKWNIKDGVREIELTQEDIEELESFNIDNSRSFRLRIIDHRIKENEPGVYTKRKRDEQ